MADLILDQDEGTVLILEATAEPLVIPTAKQSEVVILSSSGPKGDPGPQGPVGPSADATALIQTHVQSPTPHPAYDDMEDLVLIFENGLI